MTDTTRPTVNNIAGKAPSMVCPHCKEKAYTRCVREEGDLTRTLYYRCDSVFCGFTFVATLAITNEISPPAQRRPGVNLPPSPLIRVPGEPPAADATKSARLCMIPRMA